MNRENRIVLDMIFAPNTLFENNILYFDWDHVRNTDIIELNEERPHCSQNCTHNAYNSLILEL